MGRKIIIAIFAAASFAASALVSLAADVRRAVTFEELHASSCRVLVTDASGRGASGSGVNIGVRDDFVIVSTNFHVVDGFDSSRVDYFGDYDVYKVSGRVANVWYDQTQPWDFAILEIPISAFGERTIYFTPPAPEGFSPRVGDVFVSSGCPGGRNASILKCYITSFYGPGNSVVQYKPAPIPGRSGSGCFFWLADGLPYLGAVTTWRIAQDGAPEDAALGAAISVKNLYAAVDGRRVAADGRDAIPPNAVELIERFRVDPAENSAIPPGAVEIAATASTNGRTKAFDDYLVSRFVYPGCRACLDSEEAFRRIDSVARTETFDAATAKGAAAVRKNNIGIEFPVFVASRIYADRAPVSFARFVGFKANETETAILTALSVDANERDQEKKADALVSGNDAFQVAIDPAPTPAPTEPPTGKGVDAALPPASPEPPPENEVDAAAPTETTEPVAELAPETPPRVPVETVANGRISGLFDDARRGNDDGDSDAAKRPGLGGRIDATLNAAIQEAIRTEIENLRPLIVDFVGAAAFWAGACLAGFYFVVRFSIWAVGKIPRLPRFRLVAVPADGATGNAVDLKKGGDDERR